jgi:hypothetical protein
MLWTRESAAGRWRLLAVAATLALVLTTGPVERQLECRAMKNGHVCNATPGCTWPEFKRPTPVFEQCWPIKKVAYQDIYYRPGRGPKPIKKPAGRS